MSVCAAVLPRDAPEQSLQANLEALGGTTLAELRALLVHWGCLPVAAGSAN